MKIEYTTRDITFAELVVEVNESGERLNRPRLQDLDTARSNLEKLEASEDATIEGLGEARKQVELCQGKILLDLELPFPDCGDLSFTICADPSMALASAIFRTALMPDDEYLYMLERFEGGFLDATKRYRVFCRAVNQCVKMEGVNTKSKWAKALSEETKMAEVLQNFMAVLAIYYDRQMAEQRGKLDAPLKGATSTETQE